MIVLDDKFAALDRAKFNGRTPISILKTSAICLSQLSTAWATVSPDASDIGIQNDATNRRQCPNKDWDITLDCQLVSYQRGNRCTKGDCC